MNEFNRETLTEEIGGELIFDVECYPNFFCVCFKSVRSGRVLSLIHGEQNFTNKICWLFSNFTTIGFNNTGYDNLMVTAANLNYSLTELYNLSKQIITEDLRPYDFYKSNDIKFDHDFIDIQPVCFGKSSLKLYGGRIGVEKLENLPYDPHTNLTDNQKEHVETYCLNDLDITLELYKHLSKEFKLRRDMSEQYNIDLMSKSDAQIAETVICNNIKKITGRYPKKPKSLFRTTFQYDIPDYMSFKNPVLSNLLEILKATEFYINEKGSVECPHILNNPITIGTTRYQLGIGGLHSIDEKMVNESDDETLLIDRDVASYYPNIILNQRLYPPQLGEYFLEVYGDIVDKRLYAKLMGDKMANGSLKIIINGSFGQMGNPWSRLYSPKLMIQTTVTGQLSLLMLIETLEHWEFKVVSANTDGVVIKCSKDRKDLLDQIVDNWEHKTSFQTDETNYKALYTRDINNYIAITTDGKVKTKGAYVSSSISKNPTADVCIHAAIQKITLNIPVEDTIINCLDVQDFCCVRTVKGGGQQNNVNIGKVVRFYYKKNHYETINYVKSGNKVPDSDGGYPLMNLTKGIPDDIDYDRYINKANAILKDIGFIKGVRQDKLF